MSFLFEVHPTTNQKWQWRLWRGNDLIARGTDYESSESACRIEIQKIKNEIRDAPVVTTNA